MSSFISYSSSIETSEKQYILPLFGAILALELLKNIRVVKRRKFGKAQRGTLMFTLFELDPLVHTDIVSNQKAEF